MQRIISRWVVVGMAVAGLSLVARPGIANNVVVTNTSLKAPVAGKVQVQFDLSWNNSWRDGVNYDACWVFVKYSTNFGTNWNHAALGASGTNPAGFISGRGTNLEIIVPEDKMGAFIQRSAAGTGTVANTDVQLVWDFASNSVSKSQSARVKVYALEMVYVAQGSFYAGDGLASPTNLIHGHFENGISTNPLLITSEGQLILGGGAAGSLGNYDHLGQGQGVPYDDFGDSVIKTLPAAFPKGFAAFYLMKTELSQRQYCDFLNTLTYSQQTNRHYTNLYFNLDRNFIKKTSGSPGFYGCDANNNAGPSNAVTDVTKLNETNDAGWVACNYLSWGDHIAYLDWAALRPFTELEFEKACRGTLAAVTNENAWGTTNFGPATTSLTSSNTASETPNQGNCNYSGCVPAAVYRVGSYATASSSSRTNAGASYYGALDLSGNNTERIVPVGISNGRGFTGLHGDGILNVNNGNADVSNWPVEWGGHGVRGASWANGTTSFSISGRGGADWSDPNRFSSLGMRGARTAPASVASPGGSHDAFTYGGSGDSYSMDQSQDRSLDLPAGTIFKIW